MTYLIVPANHPIIPFPLNLEDRVDFIIRDMERETRSNINPKIKIIKNNGRFDDINYYYYELTFNNMSKYQDILEKYGAIREGDQWVMVIN